MNFVTVDELSLEIQKHTDSRILPELLDLLRAKHIDLREFCKRVRMVLGAEVLINTVRGLQHSQQHKSRSEQSLGGGVAITGANGSASSVAGSLSRPGSAYEADLGKEQAPSAEKLEITMAAVPLGCADSSRIGVANHALAGVPGGSVMTSATLEAARRLQAQSMMASGKARQVHLQSQPLVTPGPMMDPMAAAFAASQGRTSPPLAHSWAPAAAGMGAHRMPTGHGAAALLQQASGPSGGCVSGVGVMDLRQVRPASARCLAPACGRGSVSCAAPVSCGSSLDPPQLHASGGGVDGGTSPPELSVKLDPQAPPAAAPPNPLRGLSLPSEPGDMDSPGKSALLELKEMSGDGDGRIPHVPANFKVLIHALLCPKVAPAEQCSMEGCAKMKDLLSRVEQHTKSCSAAIEQGEELTCTTCIKWRQMVRCSPIRVHPARVCVSANGRAKPARVAAAFPPVHPLSARPFRRGALPHLCPPQRLRLPSTSPAPRLFLPIPLPLAGKPNAPTAPPTHYELFLSPRLF
jgi:hypothetical protein